MSTEDLKPYHFKPGQSGNPAGREKGSKNRATVLKELLNLKIEGKTLDGKEEKMTVESAVIGALVRKAMNGDVTAIKEIQDTVHGKMPDKLESESKVNVETSISKEDQEILDRHNAQVIAQYEKTKNQKEPK